MNIRISGARFDDWAEVVELLRAEVVELLRAEVVELLKLIWTPCLQIKNLENGFN